MSVDRNAMARALIKEGKTENDLFIALDEMRTLAIKILDDDLVMLDAETRTALQEHVDALKPIMNSTFRPVGIHSDPFTPRYAVTNISYLANERGFIVLASDDNGRNVLKPFVGTNHPETRNNLGYAPYTPLGLDDPDRIPVVEIKDLALRLVESLAHQYELPLCEPNVFENEELDYLLNETLAEVDNVPATGMRM